MHGSARSAWNANFIFVLPARAHPVGGLESFPASPGSVGSSRSLEAFDWWPNRQRTWSILIIACGDNPTVPPSWFEPRGIKASSTTLRVASRTSGMAAATGRLVKAVRGGIHTAGDQSFLSRLLASHDFVSLFVRRWMQTSRQFALYRAPQLLCM